MEHGPLLKKMWLIQCREGRLEDYYNVDMSKDVIGQGSFATVVKATLKDGHHLRAIKILRKERISDQEKFKAEIDILKKLDHPNIIKLYETFEDPQHVYLVTELCKGGEVFDRIIEKGQFSEAEARKVFTDMMRAISYCHAHGICHRDLKPENFMYVEDSPDSSIKVIDFGLARNFVSERNGKSTKTKMTTKVGTSYYIAPEVLSSCYDESCDIWSAGVILYILLAGYPPFDGRTDLQIVEKVVKGKYSLETPEWKDVSESAKDLIRHMICKPENRLKAAEVLQHSWVLQDESKDGKTLNINFQTLKNFRNAQKFKKVALTAIASQMSEAEIKELSEQFTKLDKNGDGVLTFEELEAGLDELKEKNLGDIRAILDSVDTDKNGTIDYTEFISATMERSAYLKEEKLLEAFKLFDKDGNGKITADELREILGNDPVWKQDLDYYEQMIKEADLDGDGMIDYNEFVGMMKRN